MQDMNQGSEPVNGTPDVFKPYYVWTYAYRVGSATTYVNARNRKAADAIVKKHGIPASAFIGRD